MKKVVLALLSVAALGTTLSAPFAANAREVRIDLPGRRDISIDLPGDRRDRSYDVLYRRNRRSGWQYYGTYDSRFRAERAAWRLERQGYRAYVERR
ncbi:MAG: hypothetical protein MH252_01890 [Thermosynechococcaceae cyanobacterium MS004]|jgi:hypothetical protein|nr:hypothetical protein [Thermosynechococcaceae cyanobacterium MS004]